MRIRDHPESTAALLLVGIAAFHAMFDAAGGWPQGALLARPVLRPLPPVGSSARKDMDWCLQNVAIIHDVYWASACVVAAQQQDARRVACLASHPGKDHACETGLGPPDDSSDCTLPDQRAGELNVARAKAEQQCMDEAAAR
ncbi:hypothetical protein [Ramlibacter alkalitolerans]|uniref:Uncharacterized protein n=1 Tax=Ramlibacter alkalitolerans TaxID=2039631 RepID=A0ABS1JPP5_9BURK|nr:hypothetical protein [Ramlibacter alkalitolerans]MBL0426244.1 hypothetical protein [Ramlibacter alkalitolerans]